MRIKTVIFIWYFHPGEICASINIHLGIWLSNKNGLADRLSESAIQPLSVAHTKYIQSTRAEGVLAGGGPVRHTAFYADNLRASSYAASLFATISFSICNSICSCLLRLGQRAHLDRWGKRTVAFYRLELFLMATTLLFDLSRSLTYLISGWTQFRFFCWVRMSLSTILEF